LVSVFFVACGSDGSSSGTSDGTTPSCAQVCPDVLAAHCPNGPVDEADCEDGCQTLRSQCGSQYSALFECAGAKPKFTCGSSAIGVVVSGCEDQFSALADCLAASPR
jgi:hypothetical protein